MRTVLAAVLLALAACTASEMSEAQSGDPITAPAWVRVSGVAADDVLNARAEPDAASEIVGRFDPGQGPVEIVEVREVDGQRWGLVSTIRAPLPVIARFAAHHLELGAQALHIYLDAPEAETAAFLERHPRIHVTRCDDAWWQATGKPRPEAHQLRQAHIATRCLRAVG